MRRLEKELAAEAPVRLVIDPVALKARFATEAKQPDAAYWNPPNDPASYTRVLVSFLPPDAGGTAAGPEMMNAYRRTMIPTSLFTVHSGLLGSADDIGVPEVVERIQLRAVGEFFTVFLAPPAPRELLQRGQFTEVTPILVKRREHFTAARERIRTDRNLEKSFPDWRDKARDVFTAFSRARASAKTNPTALSDAQRAIDTFWQQEELTARALVDLAVGEAGHAEATYLLAQCMHEQAERAQARYELAAGKTTHATVADRLRRKAADAWAEARTWWSNYEEYAAGQDRAYPGRAAHSRRLADRAAELRSRLSSR
jgi:hypothetical protein